MFEFARGVLHHDQSRDRGGNAARELLHGGADRHVGAPVGWGWDRGGHGHRGDHPPRDGDEHQAVDEDHESDGGDSESGVPQHHRAGEEGADEQHPEFADAVGQASQQRAGGHGGQARGHVDQG